MDWNMCLPRSFFWIWNLGGTHQLKRNPGLYFSPGNMHIITCTLHPPIVWDEIWWYTCPSCRNRGGKLQVGTTQQIESISFGLKTFFFRFRIRLNENYWFGICVFLGTRSNPFEPVHRPFEPVRACKKATFLAVRTRSAMQHFVAFWGDFLTIFLTPKWRFWRPPSDPQCPSKYLHSELIWNALGFLRRTWRILAVFWDRGGFSNSGVNILLLYMIYNIKPTLQFYNYSLVAGTFPMISCCLRTTEFCNNSTAKDILVYSATKMEKVYAKDDSRSIETA